MTKSPLFFFSHVWLHRRLSDLQMGVTTGDLAGSSACLRVLHGFDIPRRTLEHELLRANIPDPTNSWHLTSADCMEFRLRTPTDSLRSSIKHIKKMRIVVRVETIGYITARFQRYI